MHRADIESALTRLPDQARVVMILHEYLGYQHNEIAQITGMAVGTSKSHLHRARDTLKQRAAA
jgi:RNA polymerase sigma-70 factor (ECF subfamily)